MSLLESTIMWQRRWIPVLAGVVAVGAVMAACGSDADESSPSDVSLAFELTTSEMGDMDVSALPQPTVAADVSNLGEGDTPGYLYGVWDPDRGVHQSALGLSDIEGDEAIATDRSFRIGSITKTFTATAVLLLVDDGDVDLDEPVATYTADLTAALPGGDTATVRELLGMMSGFPEYSNDPAGPFGQALLDPAKEFTAEDIVAFAATQEPTPTDVVTYVNTNYIVLGELIEQVSEMSYSEFVKERILDPIGLDDTIIPDQTDTAETTTNGYLNAGAADFPEGVTIPDDVLAASEAGTDVTELSTSVGGTAGNGVSTLDDLARWAAADFGNVLLSEESKAARLDGNPADSIVPGSSYGLGLQILGDWHFHGGEIFGWESQAFGNPTTAQVTVVNANACCGIGIANLYLASGAFPDDSSMSKLNAILAPLVDN